MQLISASVSADGSYAQTFKTNFAKTKRNMLPQNDLIDCSSVNSVESKLLGRIDFKRVEERGYREIVRGQKRDPRRKITAPRTNRT